MSEKWTYARIGGQKRRQGTAFEIRVDNVGRLCEGFATDRAATPARGRLIAAAPDLLRSLKAVLESGLNRKTLESALAAIKLAESAD